MSIPHNSFSIYRAVVHSADSATGAVRVLIPSFFGASQTVSVSPDGLTETGGVYAVPPTGSTVFVFANDDLSQVFWPTGSGDGGASDVAVDLADHISAADPHPQYHTQAEGDARYLRLAGGAITGATTISVAPVNPNDLVRKVDLDNASGPGSHNHDASYVNTTGDTMTGVLNMSNNKITGLAAATANGDAVRFEQLNSAVGAYLPLAGGTLTGPAFGTTFEAVGSGELIRARQGGAGVSSFISTTGSGDLGFIASGDGTGRRFAILSDDASNSGYSMGIWHYNAGTTAAREVVHTERTRVDINVRTTVTSDDAGFTALTVRGAVSQGEDLQRWVSNSSTLLAGVDEFGNIFSTLAPTAASHLTRKDYVDTADALRVLKSGDTLTGHLLGITPTLAAHLTRKDYVDTGDAASATALANHLAAPDPHPQYLTPAEGDAAYVNTSGDTLTGHLLGITPTLAAHLTRKDYVDTADGLRVLKAGDTLTGHLLGITPTLAAHLTRKDYVDTADGLRVLKAGDTLTGHLLGITPTLAAHLTRKDYVDTADGLRVLKAGDTLTGHLLGITPTLAAHLTRKDYVDTADGLRVLKAGDTMTGTLTAPNVTVTSAVGQSGPILVAGNSGDIAGVRFGSGHSRSGNFDLGNVAPSAPFFLPDTDGLYLASAWATPSAFETSPDGVTWTDAGVANGKRLFARSSTSFTQTTRFLRIVWDAGATFRFPSLVTLRGAGATTSLQGRITVESLTAADVLVNTWGPTATTIVQEGPLIVQAINTYNGTSRKVRVTIELTNWVATNTCNWRMLNIYSGSGVFSAQAAMPMTWTEHRGITMQPTSNVSALDVRGVVGQTAALQRWQNSAGTDLARIGASGVLGLQTSGAGSVFDDTNLRGVALTPFGTLIRQTSVNGGNSTLELNEASDLGAYGIYIEHRGATNEGVIGTQDISVKTPALTIARGSTTVVAAGKIQSTLSPTVVSDLTRKDYVDLRILRSGDTLTGHLAGITPVSPDHLTRKDYVDGVMTTHLAAPDPHPQYLTQAEADLLFLTVAEGDAAYVNVDGDTMTGHLSGITPIDVAHLTRKDYVDLRVLRSGDTMTGHLLGITPTIAAHLTRKDYVDGVMATHVGLADPHTQYLTSAEADALFLTPAEGDAAYVNTAGDTMTGHLITITPTLGGHAVNKTYADGLVPAHVALADPHAQYRLESVNVPWAEVSGKPSPVITLAGDATGSVTLTSLGNGTLTVTVLDDSHTHDVRYYTQAQINAFNVTINANHTNHVTAASGAHAATAISFAPPAGFVATNVQTAIVEARDDAFAWTDAHLLDAVDAHDASSISYDGFLLSPISKLWHPDTIDDVQESITTIIAEIDGRIEAGDVNAIIDAINNWDTGDTQIDNSNVFQAGVIVTDALAAGAVVASKIAANTITASQIAATTITAAQIAANTITAGQIAANTITAGQINAASVRTAVLVADSITSSMIAANTITAADIAAGTITATEIAGGTITGNKISAATTIEVGTAANKWSIVGTADATTSAIHTTGATFANTTGIWIDASGRLRLGSGLSWNGTSLTINGGGTFTGDISGASGTFTGNIAGGTIDIGGADATSFHVDATGQMWLGNATFATAPFRVTAGGALTATGATVSGNLTATAGTIGGWAAAATTLTGGAMVLTNTGNLTAGTVNNVVRLSADDATWRLWVGHATAASAPFRVNATGALTASNATVSGTITATAGTLGGWTAAATTLTGGTMVLTNTGNLAAGTVNNIVRISANDAGHRLWVGHATAASAPFRVSTAGALTATGATISGALTATSGAIGGWTVGASTLVGGAITLDNSGNITAGTADNVVRISADSGTHRLWVGNALAASAPFRVTTAGVLTATGATISGALTATSGAIGGWTVGATTLTGGSLVLTNTGNLAAGTAPNIVRISADDAGHRLWVGNALGASAPFRVTPAGALTATGATISGTVTATAGAIGGITLVSDKLYVGTGTFNNTNTAFYVDNVGRFSLRDQLSWNGTTLTIAGTAVINGAALVSGTVTASKLLITSGGSNQVSNSTFRNDLAGWSAYGASPPVLTWMATEGRRGEGCLRFVTSAAPTSDNGFASTGGNYRSVSSGATRTASVWARNPGLNAVQFRMRGDTAGTSGMFTVPADNLWYRFTHTFTGNIGSFWRPVEIYSGTNVAGGFTLFVDDLQIEEGDVPTAYSPRTDEILPGSIGTVSIANGAITATQIAANTITAGQIAANTITATQIDATSIRTAVLTADSITSAMIAANTITASDIAANTITAANIAANTITAGQIAANTITATQIDATSVRTAVLTADSITSAMIVGGTITASDIASGTITAANIAANTITAGQIAVGTITATELAADAVTASKIQVLPSGRNLLQDPTFIATMNEMWTGVEGGNNLWSLPVEATNIYGGARVLQVAGPSRAVGSRAVPVVQGQTYVISGWRRSSVLGLTTTHIRVSWWDGDRPTTGFIGNLSPHVRTGVTDLTTTAPGAAWESFSYEWTAPATAKWASLGFYAWTGTGTIQIANPQLLERTSTVLIENGAITAGKIAANTITATQIAANTITAGQIAANTITATQIDATSIRTAVLTADSITSAMIVGGTITASDIAANTITATQIAANTITGSQLSATTDITVGTAANTIKLVGTATAATTSLYSGTTGYGTGTGFYMDASGRFSLGTGLTYNGAGVLSVAGAIAGGTIDIGGDDTTSFHVDIDGGMWMGASVANKATAPFRVSNAGAVTATSGAIGGWALAATTLTSTSSNVVLGNTGVITVGSTAGANKITLTGTAAAATTALTVGAATALATGIGIFMNGSGHFRAGNPAGKQVSWNGTTLAINGDITSTVGTIGGWTLAPTTLTGTRITLDSTNGLVLVGDPLSTAYRAHVKGGAGTATYLAINLNSDGTPAYNEAATPFYAGADNRVSVGQRLRYDGATQVLTVDGIINAFGGTFADTITVGTAANKIRILGGATDVTTNISSGTNTYNTAGTGFYMDASGRFSLGQQLWWNGTALNVQGSAIVDGTITAAEIAANAITVTKLDAGAVTTAKLATDAVKSVNYQELRALPATGAIAAGTRLLTFDTAVFRTSDVGRSILVLGAGAGVGDFPLAADIIARLAVNQVVLSDTATRSVTGATVYFTAPPTGGYSDEGSFFDLANGNIQTPGVFTDGTVGDMRVRGDISASTFELLDVTGNKPLQLVPGRETISGIWGGFASEMRFGHAFDHNGDTERATVGKWSYDDFQQQFELSGPRIYDDGLEGPARENWGRYGLEFWSNGSSATAGIRATQVGTAMSAYGEATVVAASGPGSTTVVIAAQPNMNDANTLRQLTVSGTGTSIDGNLTVNGSISPHPISAWQDLPLLFPWIPAPGLQRPQWRDEGDTIAFRGHVVSTLPTAARPIAPIPAGMSTAFTLTIVTGSGRFNASRNGVFRWDINHEWGILYSQSAITRAADYTLPCGMNTMIAKGYNGRTHIGMSSGWTHYLDPFSFPSVSANSARIHAAGLVQGGPVGTSTVWTFFGFSAWGPAGGVWILPASDPTGAVRVDIGATGATAIDVGSGGYLALDGLSWITTAAAVYYPFTGFAFENGWTNFGGAYAPGGHALVGDRVYIRGLVIGGATGTVITTLPVGRRPPATLQFACQRLGTTDNCGVLEVRPDGTVRTVGAVGTTWVSTVANFSITP